MHPLASLANLVTLDLRDCIAHANTQTLPALFLSLPRVGNLLFGHSPETSARRPSTAADEPHDLDFVDLVRRYRDGTLGLGEAAPADGADDEAGGDVVAMDAVDTGAGVGNGDDAPPMPAVGADNGGDGANNGGDGDDADGGEPVDAALLDLLFGTDEAVFRFNRGNPNALADGGEKVLGIPKKEPSPQGRRFRFNRSPIDLGSLDFRPPPREAAAAIRAKGLSEVGQGGA